MLAVVLVVVSINRSEPSAAAQELLDGEQMKIMAPADPGGGWDSTAREMQASLQELVGRTEVYNVGGAGGTIGLSNFRNLEGQPSQLMVMGLVMVGAIAANESAVTLDEVTPIAELTTESLVIVVPGDSDIQTIDDLVAALEQDVGEVSWAGGSAGGAEQILAGLIAQDLELDTARRQLHRPRRRWRGDRHAAVGQRDRRRLSGVSEFLPQIEAGDAAPDRRLQHRAGRVAARRTRPCRTRASTSSSPTGAGWSHRRASPTRSVPALDDLVTDMTESAAWDEALERQGWTPSVKTGDDFTTFLDDEVARVNDVIADLGLEEVERPCHPGSAPRRSTSGATSSATRRPTSSRSTTTAPRRSRR